MRSRTIIMATKLARATSRNDEIISFVLTAGFIGGGYWIYKSRRKSDLLEVDASEARPTRHMVPLGARLDREKVARWLDESSGEGGGGAK